MKQFNSIEELQPYLNEKENTYEFREKGKLLDIEITFNLSIDANIYAMNITARDIEAWNISSRSIDAGEIKAWNIDAGNITAGDINAMNITAWDISFYAVCVSYNNIFCKSINGRRENSRYFTLEGKVIIKEEK